MEPKAVDEGVPTRIGAVQRFCFPSRNHEYADRLRSMMPYELRAYLEKIAGKPEAT